jgi:5-methylthioadenosine/S-adenosylhomocysteine deaminase
MMRILIRNGVVVTVDAERRVYPNGFVTVEGARITAVGPSERCPPPDGYDEVIDAPRSLVVPGLINMHQHHWYTLFKGIADGLLLEDWVTGVLLPLSLKLGEPAMRVSNWVAGMEMLATGTTCSLNHSVTTTTPELVAASIEPQAELGIRQVYAKDMRCKTPGNPHHPLSLDQALDEFEQEVERWDGRHDGLVRFGMALETNAHWVAAGMSTEELICRGYELARRRGLRITTHISGGTFSLEKGFLKYLRETGRTDVRYLMQLGILDPHWVLIHGIHATEVDIEHMARVGCSFVYTPSSESIRGGGISPYANAHRAGVNVALGTDGPMVDYSVDMVEQMKVCSLMQHVRHLDPTRMPVEVSLEMATINAAKALGLEKEIGSLEAGKRADIAIFDLDRPYVGVLHRPLTSFVTAGKGSDVRAVLVNGQMVYREGTFAHLANPRRMIAEAEQIGRAIIDNAGLSHRLEPAWRT